MEAWRRREFSKGYYGVCTAGGMLNAGATHLAITPLDVLKVKILNLSGWAIMISVGFMAAAGVRVSNELGRREGKAAKFAILMIVGTPFSIGWVVCAFVMVFRESTTYFFTKSEEVADAVARFSPLLACTLLLNSVQPLLSGFANGTGQEGIVAYLNLFSYYLVGLPSAVLLGYLLHLRVEGITFLSSPSLYTKETREFRTRFRIYLHSATK